ncbi:hypothetical protein [Haliangium sp.]|uniref:hypothetical protein n=1 Tax=Haliangium sp. TaxID=2663208 RepID=UPI003D0C6670
MARKGKHPSGQYRKAAFGHWLNLAFLAVGGVLSFFEPSVLLAVLPLEAGAMWVIPDLPMFQVAVDKELDIKAMMREREYYMAQLWGLRPAPERGLGARIKGLFTEAEEEPLESRVVDQRQASFRVYMEMRQIIAKLNELSEVRGLSISHRDFERFEQVINAYLRFKVAQRAIAAGLSGHDARELASQIAGIDQRLEEAAPQLRTVLLEQRRLAQQRLDRQPKMEATLELFRTRADAIVDQLRNVHSQALADPGMNVHDFLNDLVERQEILNDPLGALEADQLVNEFLGSANPAARAAQAAGKSKK